MSLVIREVNNDSEAAKEHVVLDAKEATNLKGYALVDNTFTKSGEPSNEFRHMFLFPNLKVEKGECIRVYTGEGTYRKATPSAQQLKDGYVITHHLYWNSGSPVWNDKEGDRAVLIKFSVVDTYDVPPKKRTLPKFTSKKS